VPENRGEVAVVDASALIAVRRLLPQADQRRVFEALALRARQRRLVFPPEIKIELDRYAGDREADPVLRWVGEVEDVAMEPVGLDVVKRVLGQVGDVVDPAKQVEDADPFVLALALAIREDGNAVVVVTEERKDRPDKMSMNTACGLLRIPCLTMRAAVREQGIVLPWP